MPGDTPSLYPEGYAKKIPAGTVLECVGHYDNSAANPANPDPNASLRWGEQTFEEMFAAYLDTVVPLE